MKRRQYVVVELRKSEQLKAAQNEAKALKMALAAMQSRVDELEVKLGFEMYLNNELCDLCRSAGVSFRPALDRARRRS